MNQGALRVPAVTVSPRVHQLRSARWKAAAAQAVVQRRARAVRTRKGVVVPVTMGGLGDQVRQAWIGVKREVELQPTLAAKVLDSTSVGSCGQAPAPCSVQRAARTLGLVLAELVGIIKQIPYALRALRAHQHSSTAVATRLEVARYGPAPRNTVDVYSKVEATSEGRPVCLFVHGGIWATGEKWQYAPMARRLAEEGNVVVIMEYTLYPDALADAMVAEVDAALEWVFQNIDAHGGDPDQLALMGHSAGGQLASMALWQRAARGARQPRAFVGLAGCYHVAEHYDYEDMRGVAEISTMKPAMGGPERFDAQSPAVCAQRLKAGEIPLMQQLPPTILLHSAEDTTVPWSQSAAYSYALNKAGAESVLLLYPSGGHGDCVVSWWSADDKQRHSKQGVCTPKLCASSTPLGVEPLADLHQDLIEILKTLKSVDLLQR